MKALGIEVKLNITQVDSLIQHIKENYSEVYHKIYLEGWNECVKDYHHMRPECCGNCNEGCKTSPCGRGYIPINANYHYGDNSEDYDE